MPDTDGQDRDKRQINDGSGRLEKDNQMEVTQGRIPTLPNVSSGATQKEDWRKDLQKNFSLILAP